MTVAAAVARMSRVPKSGAMKVPTELKACARLRRLEAVAGRTDDRDVGVDGDLHDGHSGGEDDERAEEDGKEAKCAAGRKPAAPRAMTRRPKTIVFL